MSAFDQVSARLPAKATITPMPTSSNIAIVENPQSAQTQIHALATRNASPRKSRRLRYVKCDQCSNDKQKCDPEDREWPQKCERCIEKDLPCSEGTAVPRKPRRAESGRGNRQPNPDTTPILPGLTIEDWTFLVSYRKLMAQAMDCLHQMIMETSRHFLPRVSVEELLCLSETWMPKEGPHRDFEKFFTNLNNVVLKGANNILRSESSLQHSNIFRSFLGPLISEESSFRAYSRCPLCERENDENDIELELARIGDIGGQYLIGLARLNGFQQSQAQPSCHHDDAWSRGERLRLLELSAGISTKARALLKSLNLLDQLPELSRSCLSFVPDEFSMLGLGTEVGRVFAQRDCLGRSRLHRGLGSRYAAEKYIHGYNQLVALVRMNVHIGDVDIKDILGRTALHLACQRDNTQLAQILLCAGADWAVETVFGALPLHYAAAAGSVQMCKELIRAAKDSDNHDHRDNAGYTPLRYAVRNGHVEIAKLLLATGKVDPNNENDNEKLYENEYEEYCNAHSAAALVIAATLGNLELVTSLLDGGANPNISAIPYDFTALHISVINGQGSIVRVLAEHNDSNVNVTDSGGHTALHFAAEHGHLEIVRYLSNHKDIHLNLQTRNGRSPLMEATFWETEEVVEELLKIESVDLFLKDKDGETALDFAGRLESNRIADMLEAEMQRRENKKAVTGTTWDALVSIWNKEMPERSRTPGLGF
ncbi:ankyrin repeat-containing domain protein [Massariosphaeria phaeospora]|uniref:Ankyrin repeat-containing domain protein n=1 Tax=Massariosphaeria phaeospora TaxID=100035 RepID=A0A7C8I523_9PLEO|nr:ankyrin repeat-containing domain protein [Massariosphaeria phaeospora]